MLVIVLFSTRTTVTYPCPPCRPAPAPAQTWNTSAPQLRTDYVHREGVPRVLEQPECDSCGRSYLSESASGRWEAALSTVQARLAAGPQSTRRPSVSRAAAWCLHLRRTNGKVPRNPSKKGAHLWNASRTIWSLFERFACWTRNNKNSPRVYPNI